MIWQKIKKIYESIRVNMAANITYKCNPDGSSEVKLSLSQSEDAKKIEEMLKIFTSANIKTIGELSQKETFTGLVAAAMYFFHINKYVEAAKYAEEALKNEPKENNLRIWLIKIYGNYIGCTERSAKQKAINLCEEALRREPNNYEALLCKAIYTSHIKTPNEGIPLYLVAKKSMESQNLRRLSNYGQLCSFLGSQYLEPSIYKDRKQAETLFRQAILTLQSHADANSKFWLGHTEKCLEKLLKNS